MMSIGGDNLQFHPKFVPFLTSEGMKLDHYCFYVSISTEDQKKVFTENLKSFVPESQ